MAQFVGGCAVRNASDYVSETIGFEPLRRCKCSTPVRPLVRRFSLAKSVNSSDVNVNRSLPCIGVFHLGMLKNQTNLKLDSYLSIPLFLWRPNMTFSYWVVIKQNSFQFIIHNIIICWNNLGVKSVCAETVAEVTIINSYKHNI